MRQSADNWNLFGLDLRLIAGLWRASWRQFLWGADSPVTLHLDEPVRVHHNGAVDFFVAGVAQPAALHQSAASEAILLPDDAVLSKTLALPAAVEADLDAVMVLELGAHNPFPVNDTVAGWTILGKTGDSLQVGLAIAAASATKRYLAAVYPGYDAATIELWARVGSGLAVLQGFGEGARRQRYRRRLQKVAALLLLSAMLVLALAASFALGKHFELQRYQGMAETIEREASGASQARQALLKASETMAAVNAYVSLHPSAHLELARLTSLLGDDASLINLAMRGNLLQLRGRATDAAAVVQEITAESAYENVSSPQAITKLGRTGLEEFHLEIDLVQGEPP